MDAVKKKIGTLKAKQKESEEGALYEEAILQEIISKAEALEEQNTLINDEMGALEDELDAMESKLSANLAKLTEVEKAGDESMQAKKILENRGAKDMSKSQRLELEYQATQEENEKFRAELEKVTEEMLICEEEFDTHDERLEVADNRVKELEVEVTQVGNTLRSIETAEGQCSIRSQSGQTIIEEHSSKLKETEDDAVGFEEKVRELEAELEGLEENLAGGKEEFARVKQELDSFINQLAEM